MSLKSLLAPADSTKINKAIEHELYASSFYKRFAACLQNMGYFGCQKYFQGESEDELKHYQKWVDFINDRGELSAMPTIAAVKDEPKTLIDFFRAAYDLELELEEYYHDFYKKTSDVAIQQRLLEFIEIQRTSIGEFGDLIATLERCGDEKGALLLFDKEIID